VLAYAYKELSPQALRHWFTTHVMGPVATPALIIFVCALIVFGPRRVWKQVVAALIFIGLLVWRDKAEREKDNV